MKKIFSILAVLFIFTATVIMYDSCSRAAGSETQKSAVDVPAYPASSRTEPMGVTCAQCHGEGEKADYSGLMYEKCIACHGPAAKIAETSQARLGTSDNVHNSAHWGQELACSMCHTVHKENTQNFCVRCHEQPSMKRLVVKQMPKDGMADHFGKYSLFLIAPLITAHAVGRAASRRPKEGAGEQVFVYPAFVRFFHWVNAALVIIQLYTGFAIHFVDASWAMEVEKAIRIHRVAGMLMAANFVLFLRTLLVTGEIKQYLPHAQGLAARLGAQVRYYLAGMFRGEPAPFATTRENRFNPLQQLTYLMVFILGMPLLIVSGLALLLVSYSWMTWIHYCMAILYGLFLVGHVYFATTGKTPGSLIKGMITGYYEKK